MSDCSLFAKDMKIKASLTCIFITPLKRIPKKRSTFISECSMVCHMKCSTVAHPNCGLPTEYAHHFNAIMETGCSPRPNKGQRSPINGKPDEGIRIEGWLKVPK